MPSNPARKKAIREYMAAHGLSYSEAARQMGNRPVDTEPDPQPELPAFPAVAHYDFDAPASFDAIPLGVDIEGRTVAWSIRDDAHLLITGRTGAGKSVAMSALLHGALAAGVEVAAVALWNDFDHLAGGLADLVTMGADDDYDGDYPVWLAKAADLADSTWQEVKRRHELLKQHCVGRFEDLPVELQVGRRLLCIDDFDAVWADKFAPQSRDVMLAHCARIASVGRAVGVNLLLVSQRDPSDPRYSDAVKYAITVNCARLRFPDAHPSWTSGRAAMTRLSDGSTVDTQVFYATPEQYAEHLA